jgi:signal transduction histidine kinase
VTVTTGPYVFVTVFDEGGGLSEEALQRAFEPFYSTKSHRRGLGLATCLGIVKQAGGAITLENRAEGAAKATIYLPLVKGGLGPLAATLPATPVRPREARKAASAQPPRNSP